MQPEGQSFWWFCGKEGNSVAVAEMQVVEIHSVKVVVQVLVFAVVFVFAAVAAAPHYSSPSPKAERSKCGNGSEPYGVSCAGQCLKT